MNLIELYHSILSVGALSADQEGLISANMEGESLPYTVDNKRLVLPTLEHLKNPNKSAIMVFHPLNENLLHGESKVMERFRHAVNIRMNYAIGAISQQLLELGVDVASHKRFNPDQALILSALKDADDKTLTAFNALVKVMGHGNPDKAFVHIYLRRGGVVNGVKYNRACIVTFPLYEELLKEDKQIYGVTFSKKQKGVIKALLEYIFPKIAESSGYDYGSLSDIAPFTDSLMKAVLHLAMPINNLLSNYENLIHNAQSLRYADEWVEPFENLASFYKEIKFVPPQEGNEGQTLKSALSTPTTQLTNVKPAVQAYQAPAGMQPIASSPEVTLDSGVIKNASGAIDMNATLNQNPQLAQRMGFAGGYNNGFIAPPPGPQTARQNNPRWDNNSYFRPQNNYYHNQMGQNKSSAAHLI